MNWTMILILAGGLVLLAFFTGIACWYFADEQPEVDDHDWMCEDEDPDFWKR